MPKKPIPSGELDQLRAAMAIAFPKCFAPKGGEKKPLKVDIHKDLYTEARATFPGLSLRYLRIFLADYTRGHNYLICLKSGVPRIDLNGSFAGFVKEGEEVFAKKQLARMKERKPPLPRFRNSPLSTGAKTDSAPAVTEKPRTELEREQWRLKNLKDSDFAAEMSDNWYHTSGRKAEMKEEIRKTESRIKELEAASAVL